MDRVIFEAHILHESTLRLVSVLINGGSINLILHDDVVGVVGVFLVQALLSDLVALLIGSHIGDHIDIGPVDILESSLVSIDADAHGFIDAGDLHAVTWSHMINQVLIRAQVNRLRCFTFRDTLRGLLALDVLLVREDAGVEVWLEGVTLLAVDTVSRLLDASHLDRSLLLSIALSASEVSLLHLGHDIAIANNDTSQRHQFLDVVRAKLTDAEDFSEVVRANLDDLIVAELIVVHVVVSVVALSANVVHVELFKNLCHNKIENGDDIGGVVLDLSVKHLIELEDMVAVDIEHVAIQLTHFLQLLDVVGSFLILLIVLIIVIILDLLKVVDEVFEFHLDIACVNVRAPKHLGMRTHFRVWSTLQKLLTLIVHHASARGFVVGELDLLSARWVKHWLIQEAIHVEEATLLLEV